MSRSLGCAQVTSRPSSKIWPPVTASRPEIMRSVGGFAAAGRPQQHHEFAVVDGQIHRFDGVKFAEFFLNVNQFNRCHAVIPGE